MTITITFSQLVTLVLLFVGTSAATGLLRDLFSEWLIRKRKIGEVDQKMKQMLDTIQMAIPQGANPEKRTGLFELHWQNMPGVVVFVPESVSIPSDSTTDVDPELKQAAMKFYKTCQDEEWGPTSTRTKCVVILQKGEKEPKRPERWWPELGQV